MSIFSLKIYNKKSLEGDLLTFAKTSVFKTKLTLSVDLMEQTIKIDFHQY